MKEDKITFHRQVAEELLARYQSDSQPEGWREIVAWHWEQAGAYAEAADAALDIAETYVAKLAFGEARHWTEHVLELLERLDPFERRIYELRAYALALAVLEFGGQYREGLDYAKRMLRVAHARKNREAEARALLAIGRMQRELGEFTIAEASLQQARALAERDEMGDLEAEVRFHLAKVHQLQGRHLEALQELQLAREEQELRDDRVKLAQIFTGLGDIYRVLGADYEAMTFYMRSLNLEQGYGNQRGQAILKDKIALAFLSQGKLADARASEEESLRLRDEMDDIVGQARSYIVLGMITGRMGQHEQALIYHERARRLEEQTQNQRGQGVALLHLGDEASALRNYDLARGYYLRALALAQRTKDQLALARTLQRLGDLGRNEGQREAATGHWTEALKIRETLGHADEAAALRERIRTGQIPTPE